MKGEYGGSYLSLTTRTGDDYPIAFSEAEQLEAAMEAYANQVVVHPVVYGVDKLLFLELVGGSTLRIPVSAVLCFSENTEDSREKAWEFNDRIKKRKQELHPDWKAD